MDDKLFKSLKKKYPHLYQAISAITTGNGWYKLIDELSQQLESIIVKAHIENGSCMYSI